MSSSFNTNSGNASFVESNSFNHEHHLRIPTSTTFLPSDKASSNKNDVLQNSNVEFSKSTMPTESEPLSSSQLSSASSSEISSSTSSSLLLHFRTYSAQQNASLCTDSEHDTSSLLRNLSQTQIMNSSERSKKWSGNATPTRTWYCEESKLESLHDVLRTSVNGKLMNANNESSNDGMQETEAISTTMETSQRQENDAANKITEGVFKNSNNNYDNIQTDNVNDIENNEFNTDNDGHDNSLPCQVEGPTELLFIDNADGTAYLTDVSICEDGSLLLHETVLLAQSVWSELAHELIEPNALKLSTCRDESKSPIALTPSASMLPHQIRWNEYEAKERTEVHEPLFSSIYTTSNTRINKRKRPIRIARVVRERALSRHDIDDNDKLEATINSKSHMGKNKTEHYNNAHCTDAKKKTQKENMLTMIQRNNNNNSSNNDEHLQATVLKYDDSIRRLNVSFVNDHISNSVRHCTSEENYQRNTSRQRSASPTAINPDVSETSHKDTHVANNFTNSDMRSYENQEDSENDDNDDNDDDWNQWHPSTNMAALENSTSPSFAPTQSNKHHRRTNTHTSRSLSSLTLSRTPVITLHTLHSEGWIPVHLVQHPDKLTPQTPTKTQTEEVQVNAKLSIPPSSIAKSTESCTYPNSTTANVCTPPDFRRKPSDHKYYSTQSRLSLSPVPITPEGSVNIPRLQQHNAEHELIQHHNKEITEETLEHEKEQQTSCEQEKEKEECDEVSPEREGSLSRISAFCSIDNASLATSLSMSTMASVRRRLNFSVNTSPLPVEHSQGCSPQSSMIVTNHSDNVDGDSHNNNNNNNNEVNNNDNVDDIQNEKQYKRHCTNPERRQASMSPLPCLQSLLSRENTRSTNNTESFNSTNDNIEENNEIKEDVSSREKSPERDAGTTPLLPLSVWSCNEIRDCSINNNNNNSINTNNTSVHSYAKRHPFTSSTKIQEEDPLKSSLSSLPFSPSASLSMSAAMQLSDLLTSLSFQRSIADSSMHGELAALQESLREFGISLSVPLSQSTCSTISTIESRIVNNSNVHFTKCIGNNNNSKGNDMSELSESCSLSQHSHPFVNFTQIFSQPLSSRLRPKGQNYFSSSSSSLSSSSSSSHASQRAAWWHMNNKGNEKNTVNAFPKQETHFSFHNKLTKVQNQLQSEYMQRHSGSNDSTQGSRTSSNFTTTYCRQPVRLSANVSRRSSYTSQNSAVYVSSNSNSANYEGNISANNGNINNKHECKVHQTGEKKTIYAEHNAIAPKQHHVDPEFMNYDNINHKDNNDKNFSVSNNNNIKDNGNSFLNNEPTNSSLSMRVCEKVDFTHQDDHEMSTTECSIRDDGRNSNGTQWHSIKLPPKSRTQLHNKPKALVNAQHQINYKNVMKARANKAGKNVHVHTESQRKHKNTLVGTVIPDTSVFLPFSPLSITPESSINLQEWQPYVEVDDKADNSSAYQKQTLSQECERQRVNAMQNDVNNEKEEGVSSTNNHNKENVNSNNLVYTQPEAGLRVLGPSSVNMQAHEAKMSLEKTNSKKLHIPLSESETITIEESK